MSFSNFSHREGNFELRSINGEKPNCDIVSGYGFQDFSKSRRIIPSHEPCGNSESDIRTEKLTSRVIQGRRVATVKATMMIGYRKWMSGSLAFNIEYVIISKYENMHLSNVRNWDAPLMLQFHQIFEWTKLSMYFFSAPVIQSQPLGSPDHPSDDDKSDSCLVPISAIFGIVFIFGLITLFICW